MNFYVFEVLYYVGSGSGSGSGFRKYDFVYLVEEDSGRIYICIVNNLLVSYIVCDEV